MGNVRNPVGPLPASIYWRRRVVVLLLFVVLVALVLWATTSRGSGGHGSGSGSTTGEGPSNGRTPLSSITPGPSTSRTGITARPGGRDTPGNGETTGTAPAATSTAGGSTATGVPAGSSTGGGAVAVGGLLPTESTLPSCTAPQVTLKLRSVHNAYDPGVKPEFVLTASNSGDRSCTVNVAATAAVVTIVDSADQHVWASDDCPAGRTPRLLTVPAHGSAGYQVLWNRAVTAPQCATTSGSHTAQPGTYLVKATAKGLGSAQVSFVLNSL